MSEQPEEQEIAGGTPKHGSWERLKPAVISLAILIILITVFGQLVPRLLFGTAKEKNIEKTIGETGTTPEKHIEKQVEKPTEVQTVISPEPNSPEPYAVSQASSHSDELIHSLEEKIKLLEEEQNKAEEKADARLAALVAFSQLKEALTSGKPYKEPLDQLRKIIGNNQKAIELLSTFEADPESGITTPAQLKIKFAPLIKQALADKDESALLRILHKFITIRKVGEQTGSDDEAILARAEIKLANDDFKATLGLIEQLSPAAREVFNGWVADTQVWLNCQENIPLLQLFLTTQPETMLQP